MIAGLGGRAASVRRADAAVLAPLGLLALAMLMAAGAAASPGAGRVLAPLSFVLVAVAIFAKRLVRWPSLVALLVLVVMFIPMRLYQLPASLPFHLEPYRLLVLMIAVAWLTSCVIDPRVRFTRTGFDRPLAVFAFAVVASLALNYSRYESVRADVLKKLIFFLSFFVITYLVTSVLRTFREIDFVVRVLVVSGTVVAALALVESRTGYNIFNHLTTIVPFLKQSAAPPVMPRGARLRVYASAQHPIALGAVLVMLVPFAAYRAFAARRAAWWVALVILMLGALATVSRTAVVMIVAAAIVFVWIRPREMRRMWPAIVPLLLVVHLALPGAIGSFRSAFFPSGGLVAQQEHANVGSGRLATLGPVLNREFKEPFLGEGFGTRVTQPDEYVSQPNAPILDDQWLGVLLETGVVGALSLGWLFARAIRRFGAVARRDRSPRGWLLGAAAASIASYFVSMLTYDAFSFIQVTFVLFIVLGIGAAALKIPGANDDTRARIVSVTRWRR